MNFPIFLKNDNYSFISANYSPGMKYGKSTTTNVAISPQFLTKMANDSDLEDEYIKEIGNMKKLDEQFAKQQADIGWRIQRKKKKYFQLKSTKKFQKRTMSI